MKPSPSRLPALALFVFALFFLVLVAIALRLFRGADDGLAEAVRSAGLLESTGEDQRLLAEYEETCSRLSALPPAHFSTTFLKGLLPEALPEPDEKGERLLEPVDGFQGKIVDWSWRKLGKRLAIEVLVALQSPSNTSWRVAEMNLEALPDGESVSLRLRLQTARPVVDALVDR